MKIGIIGIGFVGKATLILDNPHITILQYDINKELCKPQTITIQDLETCDLLFFCLPTPMNIDGSCYTKILSDSMTSIKNPFKIIRSTVPITFSNSMKCYFMPEFLTERNWEEDFKNQHEWIFGMLDETTCLEQNTECKKRIQTLFTYAKNSDKIKSDTCIFVPNNVAELLKHTKNSFLANKVSFFNEIYDLCIHYSIDYNDLKTLLLLDDRIGKTHLNVPGYNNNRGFGGTCFPKDMNELYDCYQSNNIKSYILQSTLYRNECVDNPHREWLNDKGRVIIRCDKKIILVTGGAGFIGSNLCKRLLESADTFVICLDNLQTGSLNNIQDLLKHPRFIFKNADVTNKQFFSRIDEIYHLACPASPPKYQDNPYKTLKTSIIGTMNMLKLAKIHKAKFLFTSTSEIYGDPLEHPQKESYWGNANTVGPRSCYDEGKRVAETLIYEYRQKHNLDCKIIRIFNTYGPNMDINDGRVITNFIKAIKDNKSLPVYGDGTQTRSFCYVDDTIDGILAMMASSEYGPINIGNPSNELTINYLINVFEKIMDRKLEIETHILPINDPKIRCPDITLAKTLLQWDPKVKLEDGLIKTIKHFK